MEVLRRETPDFISSDLWPHSPDLNPVDYETWAVMQRRVYGVINPYLKCL